MDRPERPNAQVLLAELGFQPRLTIYLAGAPGAGKTYRLLTDAQFQQRAGRRVAIGWIETKDRPGLEDLARDLPRIPLKQYPVEGGGSVADFDLEAAIASNYETIVLDELAHSNPPGATHAKRWQDALALRAAGKSVLGAFNIQHLETVALTAERIIGHPIREIVPMSFLKGADGVIALDVSPDVLESRLRSGRIVHDDDIARAAMGAFRPSALQMMRELLLQTVDALTIPVVSPAKTSTALVIVCGGDDPRTYLRRVSALAEALDLAIEVTIVDGITREELMPMALATDGVVIDPPPRLADGRLDSVRAAFVALPNGELALKVLARPTDRDVYVLDPTRPPAPSVVDAARHPYGQTVGDRMRIGYGKLVIYLGSVAGSGKTYAMLDRAHDLLADGVDVIVGLVETHGRADTAAKLGGLEILPRLPNGELDRSAIIARKPKVVLIDELAHTNEPGSPFPKRFDDVIAVLRQGISVITTLNIQHLEGLGDAVERLTGTRVRETLPDSILELADDVIFVDVTPEVLRERLREGKIYPRDRIDAALANFFRTENLAALRELAVRELMRARRQRRQAPPFARILLGVLARERDVVLIERMARLASRLAVELAVAHVSTPNATPDTAALDALRAATRAARALWLPLEGADPAAVLVAAAKELDTIVVEAPRGKRRLFMPTSFARQLLRAGAREMIALAPR